MCALEACRMCLAVDKRMCSIAGTPLQDIYERITNIQLENKDGKPVLGCNVCLHLLKKCQTFIEQSVRADETLTRICKAGTEVSRPPRLPPGASRSLSKSAVTCAWYSPWEPPECPVKVEVDVVKAEQLVETTATPNMASTSDTVTVKAPLAAEVCDVKREIVEIEIEATDPLDVKYQPYDCSKWEDEPPMQARQSGFGKVGPISKKSKTKQTSKIKQESSRCKSLPKKDPMYTRSDGVKIESDGTSNIRRGKQHQCTQCSKSFDHKGNLIRHIRTHTGEKPYHCSHCSKGFSQKCQIISHIRTHTGEKPYQCSHCSRAFGRKGNLTSHLRTHTGEKPYQCVHCNRSFREKNTLICHVRTHTGEKPFQCSYCGKMFRTPFYLGIHIRRKHTLKEKKSSTSIENK